MNDVVRLLAADALDKDPALVELLERFEESQEEFERVLDLLGGRTIVVEAPPAANSEAVFRANVSGTRK